MTARLGSPAEVLALTPANADELLSALEASVPVRPPLLEIPAAPGGTAIIFGDTHGDWRSTEAVVDAFRAAGPAAVLVGLGDYVDRTPAGLPNGSVANALYLLDLAAAEPARVVLLQGNHETIGLFPFTPRHLPREVDRLWGPSPTRLHRLEKLLQRGAYAAVLPCGAYLAHAGFPQGPLPSRWQEAFATIDERRACELVWAECDAAHSRRGVVPPWTERDLDRFLSTSGLATLWRGHDAELNGRPLYGARAMTLQTTRVYGRYGVLYARLPLDRPLTSVVEATLVAIPPSSATPEG